MTPRSVPKQGIENPFPSPPGKQEILTGLVCVCVCVSSTEGGFNK